MTKLEIMVVGEDDLTAVRALNRMLSMMRISVGSDGGRLDNAYSVSNAPGSAEAWVARILDANQTIGGGAVPGEDLLIRRPRVIPINNGPERDAAALDDADTRRLEAEATSDRV